jgi:hypothetical protein
MLKGNVTDLVKDFKVLKERVRRLETRKQKALAPKHTYEHWWTVGVNDPATDEINMNSILLPNTVVSQASVGTKYITGWQAYVDLGGGDHSSEGALFKVDFYDPSGSSIGTLEDRSFLSYDYYIPGWNPLLSEDSTYAGAIEVNSILAIPFDTDLSFDPWIISSTFTTVRRLGIGLRFQVM